MPYRPSLSYQHHDPHSCIVPILGNGSPPSLSLGSRRRTPSTATPRSGQHRISSRLRSIPRLHELELDGEVEDDVADVPRVGSATSRKRPGEGQSALEEKEGTKGEMARLTGQEEGTSR
jgi:hypothetical protein